MSDNNLPQAANFILYTAVNGDINLNVALRDETAWLTQKAMADLFAVGVPAINKHLKNIFDTGELQEKAVVSILETTAAVGKSYQTKYYHLEATQFPIWARVEV